MKRAKDIKIVLQGEEYEVQFDSDGIINKILFYSAQFDEWIDATKQLSKYESLVEPAKEKYQEWLDDQKVWREKYGEL